MRLSFLQSRSSAQGLPNQVNHSLGAYRDTEAVRVVRVGSQSSREPVNIPQTIENKGFQEAVRVVRVVRVENNKVCNTENKKPKRTSLEYRFKANGGKSGGVIIGDGGLVETVRSLITRYGSRVDFDDLHTRMLKRFAVDDVKEAEKLIFTVLP